MQLKLQLNVVLLEITLSQIPKLPRILVCSYIPVEAEAPVLWPRDVKSQLMGKTLMLQKFVGKRRREWVTENEMVGWHHQISAHKFEKTQGDSEEQGSLACCSPWDPKETQLRDWTMSDNDIPLGLYQGKETLFIPVTPHCKKSIMESSKLSSCLIFF